MAMVASDPMYQFEIKPVFGLDDLRLGDLHIPFTNSTLFMLVAALIICGLLWFGTRQVALVPNRTQSLVELSFEFVRNMIRDTVGEDGLKFFPLVFTLFTFILACNLIGMSPYAFTVTSHLSVTAALGMLVFAIVVVVGLANKGVVGFLQKFLPSGTPWWLAPFVWVLEFISFLIRPLTLAVRLFANMLAGHTMLKVLAGFVPVGLAASGIGLLAAFGSAIGVMGVIALEFLVAFLQAYVFAILTCIYLSEVVGDNHH